MSQLCLPTNAKDVEASSKTPQPVHYEFNGFPHLSILGLHK